MALHRGYFDDGLVVQIASLLFMTAILGRGSESQCLDLAVQGAGINAQLACRVFSVAVIAFQS